MALKQSQINMVNALQSARGTGQRVKVTSSQVLFPVSVISSVPNEPKAILGDEKKVQVDG